DAGIVTLFGASAVLGLGHLANLLAQQNLIARVVDAEHVDGAFGVFSVVAATAQAAGPMILSVIGGGDALPDTRPMFLAGAVIACVALLGSLMLRMPAVAPGRPRASWVGQLNETV